MEIERLYKLFEQHPVIVTDSRAIVKDCIFFALKGEKFDGNTFVSQALNAGAAYCVIDNGDYAVNNRCILVKDCLLTLQQLANFHRKILNIPVIGITGTNGKTTSKELIYSVLSKKYNTTATKGNLNNHIGVPLTLLSITKQSEIAIIEMGANHIGEIEQLCTIAEPNYGLITNIGKAHLEGFGSFEGVIKAKTELYSYINHKNGTIFYNASNNILNEAIKQQSCEKIAYSVHNNEGLFTGKTVNCNTFLQVLIKKANCASFQDKIINTLLIGSYNLENVLAAVTIGSYLGIEFDKIKEAIETYSPVNNRSQLLQSSKNTMLLDYYNANPTSMEAAILNFSLVNSNNKPKIAILGDMFELGAYSESEHSRILQLALSKGFNKIIVAGTAFKKADISKQTIAFDNSNDVADWIRKNPIENAYILIKGSRGSKLENVVPEL
jgi:UDP-N-acetylmuramoyl-tripeptide--D-alanyl-D-alanine ligase